MSCFSCCKPKPSSPTSARGRSGSYSRVNLNEADGNSPQMMRMDTLPAEEIVDQPDVESWAVMERRWRNMDERQRINWVASDASRKLLLSAEAIPAALRPSVWPVLAQAEKIFATSREFDAAITRLFNPDVRDVEQMDNVIRKDLNRLFPLHEQPGPGPEVQIVVLRAFVRLHPEIGYLSGMHLIGAFVLHIQPDPQAAFLLFTSVVMKFKGLFTPGQPLAKACMTAIRAHIPHDLLKHLQTLEDGPYEPETFFGAICLGTLFTTQTFPPALIARLWDLILTHGAAGLVRGVVGLFVTWQPMLMTMKSLTEVLNYLKLPRSYLKDPQVIVDNGLALPLPVDMSEQLESKAKSAAAASPPPLGGRSYSAGSDLSGGPRLGDGLLAKKADGPPALGSGLRGAATSASQSAAAATTAASPSGRPGGAVVTVTPATPRESSLSSVPRLGSAPLLTRLDPEADAAETTATTTSTGAPLSPIPKPGAPAPVRGTPTSPGNNPAASPQGKPGQALAKAAAWLKKKKAGAESKEGNPMLDASTASAENDSETESSAQADRSVREGGGDSTEVTPRDTANNNNNTSNNAGDATNSSLNVTNPAAGDGNSSDGENNVTARQRGAALFQRVKSGVADIGSRLRTPNQPTATPEPAARNTGSQSGALAAAWFEKRAAREAAASTNAGEVESAALAATAPSLPTSPPLLFDVLPTASPGVPVPTLAPPTPILPPSGATPPKPSAIPVVGSPVPGSPMKKNPFARKVSPRTPDLVAGLSASSPSMAPSEV